MIVAIVVHAADIQDRDGAKLVIETLGHRFPRLRLIWADGSYAGKLIEWKAGKGVGCSKSSNKATTSKDSSYFRNAGL